MEYSVPQEEPHEQSSTFHYDPSRNEYPSNWDRRYHQFQTRYNQLPLSPELIEVLIDGLDAWASMLPQSEKDEQGYYKAVNTWGLGPEVSQLTGTIGTLRLRGWGTVAGDLAAMVEGLEQTALALDGCYPALSDDQRAAERRIAATAQGQALRLREFLRDLGPRLFGPEPCPISRHQAPAPAPQPSPRRPPKRRASRAAAIEAIRKELLAFIKASDDHMEAAMAHGEPPVPLPRPTMEQLGRQAGVPRYTVSRCLRDPNAPELQMLWRVANDGEQTRSFARG